MRSLGAVVVAGAVLALASAGTASSGDHAQPRGGGSGGGGSSSAGASHHSSGGGGGGSSSSSGSSHSSSSGSSYRNSGGSSSSSGPPVGAYARHPRAGTGTGYRYYNGYGHGGYYPGYYPYYGGYPYYGSYYPYYGGYYGLGWGYGWSPYFSASWYGYPYGSYGIGFGYSGGYGGGGGGGEGESGEPHYGDEGEGSVRLQVQPNEAKVYVDGYYAGTVDDFDGTFQRLRISPGRHDIMVKLDGYRSQTFKVYVPIDQTLKLQHKMVPGTGDDVSELAGRPEDVARYEQQGRQQPMPRYGQQQRPPRPPEAARPPEEGNEGDFRYDSGRAPDQDGERGLVRLEVRPSDASVYVDGAFRGTGRELRQLRLAPGRHQVEVVRPGYRTIAREVDVQGGEDSDVTIDLDRSS